MVSRVVIRGEASAVRRGAYLDGGAQTPWMTRNHQIDLASLVACWVLRFFLSHTHIDSDQISLRATPPTTFSERIVLEVF